MPTLFERLFGGQREHATPPPVQTQTPAPAPAPAPQSSDVDTELFTSYQQLGTPEEIATQLQNLHSLQQDQHVRAVATHMQWKPSVLSDRMASLPDGAEVLVTGSGETQTAVVRHNNQDTPLADYAQSNWADYLPALTNGVGTPFINQSSTPQGDPDKTDAVAERLKERKESAPASPFAKKEN